MALTINTNLSSLIAQSSLSRSTSSLNQAIERMSTGFKINHAKDNAAGYSIANNIQTKLNSFDIAMDNVMLGTTLIDTASSNLELINSHIQRIRDLTEQAANGTYGEESIKAIQAEIDARTCEVNRIMASTEYNGITLFTNDTQDSIINEVSTFATLENIDESKRVINQTNFHSGETYYLTDVEDLVKLQDLVNSGIDTTNVTFELMADIDMQGINFRGIGTGGTDGNDNTKYFKGIFNGNQHIISNLTINTTEDAVGLFGYIYNCTIDSVGLENIDITGNQFVGGLVGMSNADINQGNLSYIKNCYVTGNIKSISQATGGIVGYASHSLISDSYTNADIIGVNYVGGLAGMIYSVAIQNCYAMGNILGENYVGGAIGTCAGYIYNTYSTGNINGNKNVGGLIGSNSGEISASYFDSQTSNQTVGVGDNQGNGDAVGVTSAELDVLIKNGTLSKFDYESTYGDKDNSGNATIGGGKIFTLQVGINSDSSSQISFDTSLSFNLDIKIKNSDNARKTLDSLDTILEKINKKQTEFGAVQNRLNSIIESLSISIENLTSSLSTIRDTDIANESSNYIKAQILQQASATLLSTANQNPNIAIQLL